jgi:glutathione S-transferase
MVTEVHDTHHPIAVDLYYEEQKAEAKRRAAHFTGERLPKFLGYFETVLARNAHGRWLAGETLTYADLSLFQMIEGLRYAFPRTMERLEPSYPNVLAVHDQVAARKHIKAYLKSKRRIPFNEDDIFRRYPELDAE